MWDLAKQYNLHVLHPALIEINSLTKRLAELEKELKRPFVMESGPWVASDDGKTIQSDDFTHDVQLRVDGDFGEAADRQAYTAEIARRLNNSCK